jgi:hypothetical protein
VAEHAELPAAQASPSPADAEQPAELVSAAPAPAKPTPQQPRITVEVAGAVQAAPEAAAEEQAPAAAEAPPAAAQHKGDDTCLVCGKDAGKKVLPSAPAHSGRAWHQDDSMNQADGRQRVASFPVKVKMYRCIVGCAGDAAVRRLRCADAPGVHAATAAACPHGRLVLRCLLCRRSRWHGHWVRFSAGPDHGGLCLAQLAEDGQQRARLFDEGLMPRCANEDAQICCGAAIRAPSVEPAAGPTVEEVPATLDTGGPGANEAAAPEAVAAEAAAAAPSEAARPAPAARRPRRCAPCSCGC